MSAALAYGVRPDACRRGVVTTLLIIDHATETSDGYRLQGLHGHRFKSRRRPRKAVVLSAVATGALAA